MKMIKSLLSTGILITVFAFGSVFFNGSGSVEASSSAKSCAVSYGQAVIYLQSCSHQHTVNSIQPIPGTNNYRANVDGNITTTVYIENGCITGHSDALATIVIYSNNG